MNLKVTVIVTTVIAGGLRPMSGIATPQDNPLVHEAIVNGSVDEVWQAFTTSSGLQAWMVPHAEIDLKVGGKMRTNFNPQGKLGDEETIENLILSFEPKRMLSFRVSQTPVGFPFVNAVKSVWTVVYFEALGLRQTRVRQVSLGFGEDEESRKMRGFFETADAGLLASLQKRFAAQPPE